MSRSLPDRAFSDSQTLESPRPGPSGSTEETRSSYPTAPTGGWWLSEGTRDAVQDTNANFHQSIEKVAVSCRALLELAECAQGATDVAELLDLSQTITHSLRDLSLTRVPSWRRTLTWLYQQEQSFPRPYCHACGRLKTPKWRRGPDGTLCNVCGLLYARRRAARQRD